MAKKRRRTKYKKRKSYFTLLEVKWALIILLSSLLWNFIGYEIGLLKSSKMLIYFFFILSYLVPLFFLYNFALYDKKKKVFRKRMQWKHGFRTGVSIAFLSAFVSPINPIVIYAVLYPGYFDATEAYLLRSQDSFSSFLAQFCTLEYMVLGAFLAFFVFGILVSAFSATLITKKRT